MSKFTDDAKVLKVVANDETAAEMQEVIQNLENWCNNWFMLNNNIDNIKKCCILHFGHSNKKYEHKMNGQTLESRSNQRDLGIMISDDCLPATQCALAAKKANQDLGQVKRAFSCKSKEIM